MLERRTTGHCASGSNKARSTLILITTSCCPAGLDQWGIDSCGRIKIESKDNVRKMLGPQHWRLDDQGVVTARGNISAKLLRREHFHRVQGAGGARH